VNQIQFILRGMIRFSSHLTLIKLLALHVTKLVLIMLYYKLKQFTNILIHIILNNLCHIIIYS